MHEPILNHIRSLGYVVSEFRLPSSLLGTFPAAVEMHAVRLGVDPVEQYVARVSGDDGDESAYRCACVLAEMVPVEAGDD